MAARTLFFIALARSLVANESAFDVELDSRDDSLTSPMCLLQTQMTLGIQSWGHTAVQRDVAESPSQFGQFMETYAANHSGLIRNQTYQKGTLDDEARTTSRDVFLVCGLLVVSGYLLSVAFGSDRRMAQADENVDMSLRHSLLPALAWMISSLVLTIFNKWIMIKDGGDFAFPCFTCVNHMFTATVVLWTMRFARPDLFKGLVSLPRELVWPVLQPIAGIAALMAISIVCSNIAVKHLSVAFMNMLKAANPAYALVLSVVVGTMDSKGSLSHISVSIFVMVGGAVITCVGQVDLSLFGLCYFVFGIFTEQLRLVILKWVLSGSKLHWDPLSTLAVISPFAFVFTSFICVALEADKLPYHRLASDLQLQLALLMNGLVAATLNISFVQLMDVISPVTYTVCGVAKDMVASISSLFLVGGSITPLQIVGYAISLAGFAYYDHIKAKQEDTTPMKIVNSRMNLFQMG